jgi:hypothetical protein
MRSLVCALFAMFTLSACGGGGGGVPGIAGSAVTPTSPSTTGGTLGITSFSFSPTSFTTGNAVTIKWSATGSSATGVYTADVYIDTVNYEQQGADPSSAFFSVMKKVFARGCAFDGTSLASIYSCGTNEVLNCTFTHSASLPYFLCTEGSTNLASTEVTVGTGNLFATLKACGVDGSTFQNVCKIKSTAITIN